MCVRTFEFGILNWIQANCRTDFLDTVMPFASALCNHGEVWIALAVILLLTRRYRRTGVVLALALILDGLCCNVILKPLIARVRPCDVNAAVELLVSRPTDWSFPSGHTAASFAAVGALLTEKRRLWKPAFILAVLIAFSRLYLYLHWPSDVLAGAILGTVLGFAAGRLTRWVEKKTGRARPVGREGET
ncbi:putative undecaprenyl-diphosphatase [Oscillibacter valericigenes Sjm18-20]|nr:putative undecaprenyl-diphosphatase [Oscillibacter valericigenes Sjm18-20]